MKKFMIMIVIALVIGAGIWWFTSSQNTNNTTNYQAEKSSTNINVTNQTPQTNNNVTNETPQNNTTNEVTKLETEIANFTTKIYNKDSERQNNITITCNAINSTEVQPGETFSFCGVVGKSTTAKGYQEADIYVDGKKEQGLGGGNCQVSTTLYNAVLKIPELEVVERHKHSGHVPYIQEGKDAAVSYGAYDFKFKNNTGSTIRILMENTPDNITAKIIKISL